MTHTRVLTVGVFVLAAVAPPARAQTLQVTPLQRDGQVLVSFALTDGFDDDVRAAIRSGLTTTFMTSFDKLSLFSTTTLDANAEYYLRVRVRTSPRSAWFLWPWGRNHATGRATFTFIP